MFKKKITLLIAVIMFLSLATTNVFAQTKQPQKSNKPGNVSYEHLKVLSEEIGSRVAGSKKEVEARDYIVGQFERLGFKTMIQEFSYVRKNITYISSNVVAVKPGKSSEEVIVGAHYDSVAAGKGADDNASGVAVMLEVAEVLNRIPTPYTIKFIAFGAEEVGLQGSKYYVSQSNEKEIKNTVAMINLDSLIAGDKMYVHGGAGDAGWVREQALNIVKRKKLDVEINPGLNPHYPAGTTGDWSDHAPFEKVGIPIAYFEATNWEIDDMDGYTQTEEHGSFWHTGKDTIEKIEELFPGRIEQRLTTFSEVLQDLLKFMNKTSISR